MQQLLPVRREAILQLARKRGAEPASNRLVQVHIALSHQPLPPVKQKARICCSYMCAASFHRKRFPRGKSSTECYPAIINLRLREAHHIKPSTIRVAFPLRGNTLWRLHCESLFSTSLLRLITCYLSKPRRRWQRRDGPRKSPIRLSPPTRFPIFQWDLLHFLALLVNSCCAGSRMGI